MSSVSFLIKEGFSKTTCLYFDDSAGVGFGVYQETDGLHLYQERAELVG